LLFVPHLVFARTELDEWIEGGPWTVFNEMDVRERGLISDTKDHSMDKRPRSKHYQTGRGPTHW